MSFDVPADAYDRFMGRYSVLLSSQMADLAGVRDGQSPLGPFWQAARELDRDVDDESRLEGAREGHLAELFEAAALNAIEKAALSVSLEHPSFEVWWEPFTGGVGRAGSYLPSLDAESQAELREACRRLLPDAPFVLTARAWAARGLA